MAALAFAACGETQDDERARRAARRRASPSRGGADPERRDQAGPQDGLDPQAARQPLRGDRALGRRRGARGARRLQPHLRARPTPARRRRSRSSTRPSSRSPTRSSSPATTPTRSRPRSSRPTSATSRSSPWTPTSRPTRARVFINQTSDAADRQGPGRADRRADRRQGRDRDPLGHGERDEPEHLDQVHEGGAQEARVQGHQAREDRLRRRRRPEVLPGDPGPDPGLPEPQGHHLADHGRHLGGRALPVDVAEEGQGQADRPRHAEPDAQVRQGRHGRGVRSCGSPRTSATSPARPPPRWSPAGSPARRARSSRPGASASARSAPNGEIILGPADRRSTRTTSTTSTSKSS